MIAGDREQCFWSCSFDELRLACDVTAGFPTSGCGLREQVTAIHPALLNYLLPARGGLEIGRSSVCMDDNHVAIRVHPPGCAPDGGIGPVRAVVADYDAICLRVSRFRHDARR
jgi:hypothetical protein